MDRTKKIKALYSLIGLADRAKDLQDYRLANLTFALAIAHLENDECELVYEDAGSPLSVYYDVITVYLNGRGLSIPAPLLNKDTLAECLKLTDSKIERLEHNRQHRVFEDPADFEKRFSIITSRFFKIFKAYFDVYDLESALWALDLPKGQREAFERWCNSLCQSVAELNLV
jgi:hypothetical protein